MVPARIIRVPLSREYVGLVVIRKRNGGITALCVGNDYQIVNRKLAMKRKKQKLRWSKVGENNWVAEGDGFQGWVGLVGLWWTFNASEYGPGGSYMCCGGGQFMREADAKKALAAIYR